MTGFTVCLNKVTFMLSVMKMPLKGGVVHQIFFFNFCGNPDKGKSVVHTNFQHVKE